MDKVKRLSHLVEPEERFAMTRVLDLAEKVLSNHEIMVTDFLDPHMLNLAINILRGLPSLDFSFSGGYEEAERKRCLLFQDYYQPDFVDFNLGCVKIESLKDFECLKHRDFLGAILGLGLRREKLGDIIVGEQAAFCIMTNELAQYVSTNLAKVGQISVHTSLLTNLAFFNFLLYFLKVCSFFCNNKTLTQMFLPNC
jgi:RNA-binding protein YlmH